MMAIFPQIYSVSRLMIHITKVDRVSKDKNYTASKVIVLLFDSVYALQ